ncbi:hypothetical protein C8J56DRAFT_1064043 [Mycena floridula]|nr:hypothetical protein C8J56DRAFT_1064043 [Mycena floridula]
MPVVTRRATRAQKSFLNELTTEIIVLCDTGVQATLCLVWKLFKQLAYRPMHRIVCLHQRERILSFLKNMSGPSNLITLHSGGFEAVDSPLLRMTELRTLSLGWVQKMPDFNAFFFPRLCLLKLNGRINVDSNPVFTAFLNRHPTLVELDLSLVRSDARIEPLPVELPNLVVYIGGYTKPPRILKNTNKLRSVRVLEMHLDDLALLPTYQDVVIVDIQGYQDLRDVPGYEPTVKLTPAQLAEALSGFKELESVCVISKYRKPSETKSAIQCCLVNSCPNLRECCFLERGSDTTGRFKILDGKVEPMTGLSRIETLLQTMGPCPRPIH